MPVIALPTGSGKTTAIPALAAKHFEALAIVVVSSATQAEAMAGFMQKRRMRLKAGQWRSPLRRRTNIRLKMSRA